MSTQPPHPERVELRTRRSRAGSIELGCGAHAAAIARATAHAAVTTVPEPTASKLLQPFKFDLRAERRDAQPRRRYSELDRSIYDTLPPALAGRSAFRRDTPATSRHREVAVDLLESWGADGLVALADRMRAQPSGGESETRCIAAFARCFERAKIRWTSHERVPCADELWAVGRVIAQQLSAPQQLKLIRALSHDADQLFMFEAVVAACAGWRHAHAHTDEQLAAEWRAHHDSWLAQEAVARAAHEQPSAPMRAYEDDGQFWEPADLRAAVRAWHVAAADRADACFFDRCLELARALASELSRLQASAEAAAAAAAAATVAAAAAAAAPAAWTPRAEGGCAGSTPPMAHTPAAHAPAAAAPLASTRRVSAAPRAEALGAAPPPALHALCSLRALGCALAHQLTLSCALGLSSPESLGGVSTLSLRGSSALPVSRVLRAVDACPALTALDLSGHAACVDGSLLVHIGRALPWLRVLNLGGCVRLTDADVRVFAEALPQTTPLEARAVAPGHAAARGAAGAPPSPPSPPPPSGLGGLGPALTHLCLAGAPKLTDRAVQGLAASVHLLQDLCLAHIPALTDQALHALAADSACPDLRWLCIAAAFGVSEAGVHALHYAKPRVRMYHHHDDFPHGQPRARSQDAAAVGPAAEGRDLAAAERSATGGPAADAAADAPARRPPGIGGIVTPAAGAAGASAATPAPPPGSGANALHTRALALGPCSTAERTALSAAEPVGIPTVAAASARAAPDKRSAASARGTSPAASATSSALGEVGGG